MSDIGQSATMALVVGAVNCASSMEESSESEWCRVQARTNSGGAGGGDSLKLTAASAGAGAGAVIIWRRAFCPSALKRSLNHPQLLLSSTESNLFVPSGLLLLQPRPNC